MASITDDIATYLDRGRWDRLAEAKLASVRAMSPEERIAAADRLADLIRATVPGWPGDEERAADLANHVRVHALLARAHAGGR